MFATFFRRRHYNNEKSRLHVLAMYSIINSNVKIRTCNSEELIMECFKHYASKQHLEMGMADLSGLYQRGMLILNRFLEECTTPDLPRITNQSFDNHKVIHVTASQKKAFTKAFFNRPKRNILLYKATQFLRLLVE